MSQTIGRVIRLHKEDKQNIMQNVIPSGVLNLYRKPYGNCVIPTHKNYGSKTINRIQRIVNDIFIDGHHTRAYC